MYATLSEANLYFEGRMYSESWTIADNTTRTKALIHASRLLDTLSYKGEKTDEDQEHEFPRDDATDIPTNIKYACYEITLALLNNKDPDVLFENLSVVSEGFMSARSTYDRSLAPVHIVNGIPSASAWNYILPYLKSGGQIKIHRVS